MIRTLLVSFLIFPAMSSVGGGMDEAFARAEETVGCLAAKEPASWCALTNAIESLELRYLYSTNVVSLSGTNVIVVHSEIPDSLSSRIVRFATTPRGFRPGPRQPPGMERLRPCKFSADPPVSSTLVSDGELAGNARRNAEKRKFFLLFLRDHAREMEPAEQEDWLRAVTRLWILVPYYPDGGAARAKTRREEDGIPSAEALLEWFAGNDAFCESVRAEAKARLGSLKKSPPPVPDVRPIGEAASFPAPGDGGKIEENSP